MSKSLVRITPEEAGVDSKSIQGFLNKIKRGRVHLHSYMMIKGDSVVAFFKEELESLPEDAVCENMKKMTVRHLLTMSTG